ncbi:hepatocellular carcinoma-associated antigen 59-domain-containing protein [Coniochaeta sp. 2T2.1]|nr:hepatocellular carcinoma-associated antigen 59-domain-containing protein [Coniochaeta sp. 2T2.1]
MESTTTQAPAEPQMPAFRPGKKRKIYRQRAEDADDAPLDAPAATSEPASTLDPRPSEDITPAADDDEHISLSAIRRQARKGRLGGVAFRAGSARADEQSDNTEQSLVIHDGSAETPIVGGITKRFAPQTGMVGELINKHMEEYIESELAKRHAADARAAAIANGEAPPSESATNPATTTEPTGNQTAQPEMQGKLMEIDLGDEARARNIAMTERARRIALGEAVDDEDSGSSRPRKVRLGRDGKPWRGRKRRNSEDIKRDQLVEEFLKENRLDVYDMPREPPAAAGPNLDDEGADEKIAEEFRRQFMDAAMQRQQRKRPALNAKPPARGAVAEEVLKGPKLGGSRNQRAAMRDILLRQQEGKR